MPIKLIPFGRFSPDGADFNASALHQAENLIPVYGGLRVARKLSVASSQAVNGPITGGVCFLRLLELQNQHANPSSFVSGAGNAYYIAQPDPTANRAVVVGGATPDDSQYDSVVVASTTRIASYYVNTLVNPASATNHYIRVRYRIPSTTGTWSIVAAWQENVSGTYTERARLTETGSGAVSGWVTGEYALSAGEMATFVNYNDFRIVLNVTVPGNDQTLAPNSDVATGSWLTDGGSSSNLYQTIDEATASDTDYAISPALAPGGASYILKIGLATGIDPIIRSLYVLSYRLGAENDGCRAVVRLHEGSTVIASKTSSSLALAFADIAISLSDAECANIGDFGNLHFEVEADFPTDVTPTQFQYARPSGSSQPDESFSDSWTNESSSPTGSSLYLSVDESSPDDDTTYIEQLWKSGAWTNNPATCTINLSNEEDPLVDNNHSLVVRARYIGLHAQQITVKVFSGTSQVGSTQIWTLTSSYVDYTINFTEAEISSIDRSNLSVTIATGWNAFSTAGEGPRVTQVYLGMPKARKVKISWASWGLPSDAHADISWMELQIPDPNTSYLGDRQEIYVGSENAIWLADPSGWSDVSKAGGYAAGGATPRSWNACQFGDSVIFTNFIDNVQVLGPSASLFADLITSTAVPKAKYVAPVDVFLALASISYTGGSVDGRSDEIWVSAIGDPTTFSDPSSISTQSTRFLLTQTPGEITGLIGGEIGVAFKRNSVYLMRYVGVSSGVFQPNVASSMVGTSYPRTAVPFGSRVYFISREGVTWVDRESGEVADVQNQDVRKMLFDYQIESRSVALPSGQDERAYESLFFGALDHANGIIYWLYQGKTDSSYKNNRGLYFNPRDGRVGEINASLDLSCLVGRSNTLNSDTYWAKGISGFGWDGTNASLANFSSDQTEQAVITTAKIGSEFFANSPDRVVVIHAVRLIVEEEPRGPGATGKPTVAIVIKSSSDPRMRVIEQTRSVTNSQENPQGWIDIEPVGSEYHEFTLTIGSAQDVTTKMYYGLQVRYTVEGVPNG